jgi:hypothetical protein
MKNEIAISTYHEYILEAIAAIRLGFEFHRKRDESHVSGADPNGLLGERTKQR